MPVNASYKWLIISHISFKRNFSFIQDQRQRQHKQPFQRPQRMAHCPKVRRILEANHHTAQPNNNNNIKPAIL